MRLGQLARRLDIKTDKIVSFLEKEHQVEIANHPNSKLPDEKVDAIIDQFKPDPVAEMKEAIEKTTPILEETVVETVEEPIAEVTEEITPTEVTEELLQPEIIEEVVENTTEPIVESPENVITEVEDLIEEVEEEVELNIVDGVIKAPKVEFEGPKVIGKIDLPQPKQAEEIVEVEEDLNEVEEKTEDEIETEALETVMDEVVKETTPPKKEIEPKPTPVNRVKEAGLKRPSQEELKRRRAEKAKKLKKEENDKIKARKKANYTAQLKNKPTTSKAVTKAKKTVKNQAKPKKKAPVKKPTSLWGRFMFWLNDKG